MRPRLSQPPQGWRTLGWEIAIVAIGVALAIGAERAIQQYNYNQDAKQASEAIRTELAEHQLDALERIAVQPCLKQQLGRLYSKLSEHRGGPWKGMPMPFRQEPGAVSQQRVSIAAYRAPERMWLSEAWQTARSSGSLNHLPASHVMLYSQAYHRGRQMLELQSEENAAAAKLAALALDGVIDAQTRAQLLGALAETDRANAYMELATKQNLEFLAVTLKDLPRRAAEIAVANRIATQRSVRGSCVLSLSLPRA